MVELPVAACHVGPDGRLLKDPAILVHVRRHLFGKVVVEPRMPTKDGGNLALSLRLKLLPGDVGDHLVTEGVPGVGRGRHKQNDENSKVLHEQNHTSARRLDDNVIFAQPTHGILRVHPEGRLQDCRSQ